MKQIKIRCPAKINLTLKVTGKRKDGFHNIDSIMQTISLYDYLTITVETSDRLEINLSGTSNEIPYDEKNLVYKSGMLFFSNSGEGSDLSYKVSVYIEKNIPVAAGLAGGSTDAAGMLYGLNKLFGEPLSKADLHKLCAELGSDLNFCLEGGRQSTSGRGEILEQLPFEEFKVSLIKPLGLSISAKEAYTKFSGKCNAGVGLSTPQGQADPERKSQISTDLSQNDTKSFCSAESQGEGKSFPRPLRSKGNQRGTSCATLLPKQSVGEREEFLNERSEFSNSGEGSFISQSIDSARNLGGGSIPPRSAFVNDLEWAVIDDYAELRQIKQLCPKAVMSGSGAVYYAINTEFKPQEGFWVKNNLQSVPFGVKEV